MSSTLIPTFQLNEINKNDYAKAGIKGSHIGEMVNAKIPLPGGYVVSADAYAYFLDISRIREKIVDILSTLDSEDAKELKHASDIIQDMIIKATMPPIIESAILKSYAKLSGFVSTLVAVRSSIAYNDEQKDSFAGISSTFLNIKGGKDVALAVKACWASLFEPEALYYMLSKQINPMKVGMAVVIQKMLQAEVTGVMFTSNPVTHDDSRVIIEAVLGLGEIIDADGVTPDHYELEKNSLRMDVKKVMKQGEMIIRAMKHKENEEQVKKVSVNPKWQNAQKIDDKKINELATIGKLLERLFGGPQDIEWVMESNKIYIIQSKGLENIEEEPDEPLQATVQDALEEISKIPDEPVEVIPQEDQKVAAQVQMEAKEPQIVLSGSPASEGVIEGIVRIVRKNDDFMKLNTGDILVIDQIKPDYILWMRKAGGIITNLGGITSHAAVLSREFKIPCIVGTENATQILADGDNIMLNGSNGRVYALGKVPITAVPPISVQKEIPPVVTDQPQTQENIATEAREETNSEPDTVPIQVAPEEEVALPRIIIPADVSESHEEDEVEKPEKPRAVLYHQSIKTATKIFINTSDGNEAAAAAQRDSDGVGFIDGTQVINNVLQCHPEMYLEEETVEKYINESASLLEQYCRDFNPRPVLYKPSNLISSQYTFDAGQYEEKETNPKLGFNGSFRYIQNPSLFNLEIEVIKTVRNKMGYKNLSILLPMIRDAKDLREIKKMITSNELKRSSTFKLYLPIEAPSTVFLINDLIEIGIDGIFIFANELSGYINAVDMDNYRYKNFPIFNEAFMLSAEVIIKTAHKNKIHSGIILQGKEFEESSLKEIIEWGATYLSVDPFYLDKTKAIVSDIEKSLILSRRR